MAHMHTLRVGTRTSSLAVSQATAVARDIVEADPNLTDFEIIGITTKGDVDRSPLSVIGGTGLFTSAVRDALIAGQCDIAVHSAKDLPAADHPALSIFFPPRVSPHDVFCGHVDYRDLPPGATIGSGSPRRAAQLLHFRPDLTVVDVRGNVPTRLARIDHDLDGVILARAGLLRLGIDTGQDLPFDVMVPAAAQGALALETVKGSPFEEPLSRVDDRKTRREVTAERAFMAAMGAGCTTPVGVLGDASGSTVSLHARYVGGGAEVEGRLIADDPIAVATELANEFIDRGVGE
ncbi:hydroxymethylbilane synthase [Flaviflexus salsibiostraticola]|uniref:Hydroxymethylbilane synthase n=2 Tax=Flaviflexus salsibiostraticola TaxID=1282737 RepID=A0A3S8Z9C2_9ACTO|nr:hydroxymethylbilane synthase [Flaviflexus salsibiostraticola]